MRSMGPPHFFSFGKTVVKTHTVMLVGTRQMLFKKMYNKQQERHAYSKIRPELSKETSQNEKELTLETRNSLEERIITSTRHLSTTKLRCTEYWFQYVETETVINTSEDGVKKKCLYAKTSMWFLACESKQLSLHMGMSVIMTSSGWVIIGSWQGNWHGLRLTTSRKMFSPTELLSLTFIHSFIPLPW